MDATTLELIAGLLARIEALEAEVEKLKPKPAVAWTLFPAPQQKANPWPVRSYDGTNAAYYFGDVAPAEPPVVE